MPDAILTTRHKGTDRELDALRARIAALELRLASTVQEAEPVFEGVSNINTSPVAVSPSIISDIDGLTTGSLLIADGAGGVTEDNDGLHYDTTNFTFGVGLTRSGAISGTNPLMVVKGRGTTSSTSAFGVRDASSNQLLRVLDDGKVGIGSVTPTGLFVVTTNPSNASAFNIGTRYQATALSNVSAAIAGQAYGAHTSSSSGLVTGVAGEARNNSTSNLTATVGLAGLWARFNSSGANTTTGAAGLYIAAPTITAGTITTGYGLYIAAQNHASVTNAYGIYQVGTSEQNLFGSPIAIGNAPTLPTVSWIQIARNRTIAAWGTAGAGINVSQMTFTDSTTAASGTATNAVGNAFHNPVFAAANATVTITNAASVYIPAAPTAGTNITITNAYALWVDAGTTRLDGNVNLPALTASRVVILNSSNVLATSSVSDTELGYLSGVTSAIQTQLNAKLSLSGGTMTGLLLLSADPSAALGAATKQYVDAAVTAGIHYGDAVKCATTANITLSGAQTIDGYAAIALDRVLVKNQTTAADNGVYICAAGAWARSTDADTAAEVTGIAVFVLNGTANVNTTYLQTATSVTLGVTSLVFVQIAGTTAYSAGAGISIASGVIAASNITNTEISASAAIVFSKMVALTASRAVVSDGSGFITVSTSTATEVGYLAGVTSAIQTQLNAKEASIALGTASQVWRGDKTWGNVPVAAIPTGIDAANIGAGGVSSTEFGYLDGVTSAIQTQLNAKQTLDATLTALAAYNTNGLITQTAADTFTGRTITGTANQVDVTNGNGVSGNPTLSLPQSIHSGANVVFMSATLTGLTVGRVLIAGASGLVDVSSVTTTELAFVSGVTSAIQTQLNAKEPTIAAGTASQVWRGDKTWGTLPAAAMPSGIDAVNIGAGSVSNTEFGYLDGVTSAIQTQLNAKQTLDATLTAIAAYNTNGILTQTAADTFVGRTMTGTTNQVNVTNGNGVSGNPTFSLPQNINSGATPTFAGLDISGINLIDSSRNIYVANLEHQGNYLGFYNTTVVVQQSASTSPPLAISLTGNYAIDYTTIQTWLNLLRTSYVQVRDGVRTVGLLS